MEKIGGDDDAEEFKNVDDDGESETSDLADDKKSGDEKQGSDKSAAEKTGPENSRTTAEMQQKAAKKQQMYMQMQVYTHMCMQMLF